MNIVERLWGELQAALHLAKVLLCFLVGYSALFGFFLADSTVSARALLSGAGLFFLATGAATLNSIQEHRLDAHMDRTKKRPLPRKTVTLQHAGVQATILLGLGTVALNYASQTNFPVGVALLTVVLYNGVYTPLKQHTVLAIVPGALCGALPPYIGWLVGGGSKAGFEPFLLLTLMVLWQIPHFWLVILHHKKDYKSGVVPSLFSFFDEETIRRLFITWIGGLVAVMLLFTVLPSLSGGAMRSLILFNSSFLLLCFLLSFISKRTHHYKLLFMVLNGTLFLHMTFVIVGNIYST